MEIKEIKRPWIKTANYGKRVSINPVYQSTQWKRTKQIHKAGYTLWNGEKVSNSMCLECYKQGKIKPMHTVDHIVPIEEGGGEYDLSNLQSMCLSCHNKKSAIEGNKRRKSGGKQEGEGRVDNLLRTP